MESVGIHGKKSIKTKFRCMNVDAIKLEFLDKLNNCHLVTGLHS